MINVFCCKALLTYEGLKKIQPRQKIIRLHLQLKSQVYMIFNDHCSKVQMNTFGGASILNRNTILYVNVEETLNNVKLGVSFRVGRYIILWKMYMSYRSLGIF